MLKRLIDLNLSNSQISNLILSRGDLTRILYYNQIYQNILGKPGSIMEFGVQYGLSLSLLLKLRSIYEPFNYSREIIGFDTLKGLKIYQVMRIKITGKKVIMVYQKILKKQLKNF